MFSAAGYFDESDDNERAYSVAGFLGHQKDCVYLQWEWEKRILEPYKLKYFKASELNSGKGQFAVTKIVNLNLISKFEIEHMLGTSRYRVNQKGRAKVRLPMRIEADESLGRLGGFSELNRVHRFTVAVF